MTPADFEFISQVLKRRSGLVLTPEKAYLIESRVAPLLRKHSLASIDALAKAGFTPAAAGQDPDVLVQLGARFLQSVRAPWDDPLWWGGGFGRYRHGPWIGPSWSLSWRYQPTIYQQDVAILLRDRASGKPLFEARASNDGTSRADAATLAAMFEAALMDFPKLGINPRRVTVTLPPAN